MDREVIEAIKESKLKLGWFYPVLKAKDGSIIDGHHRLAADPNWKAMIISDIDTEEKKILAKIACNFVRREVLKEEKVEMLTALAKLGWDAKKIAEETGLHINTVYKYLPETFKELRGPKGPREEAKPTVEQSKSEITRRVIPNGIISEENKSATTVITEPELDPKKLAEAGFRQSEVNPNLYVSSRGSVYSRGEIESMVPGLVAEPELAKPTVEAEPEPTTAKSESKKKPYSKGLSPRASEFRKPSYTPAHTTFASTLNRHGLFPNIEHQVMREGELNSEGKTKSYSLDLWFKEGFAVEVEGSGSSSKNNPERDEFLKDRGIPVIHLSNKLVEDHGEEVAELMAVLLRVQR